jgi:hypothetical protein
VMSIRSSLTCIDQQVMRAGMEGLSSTTKLYPQTMHLDIEVAAMGVIAPEGNLVRTGALLHPSKSTLGLPGKRLQRVQKSRLLNASHAWQREELVDQYCWPV